MKITKIETVRLTSRLTLIWVRVHTDEGLIGLGESWFGCAAVDAEIHERIAPALIGADPSRIEALTARHGLMSASAAPAPRSAPPRRSTWRSGTLSGRRPASHS